MHLYVASAATKVALEEQIVHLVVPCADVAGSVDVVVVEASLTMTVSVIVIAVIDQMATAADHPLESMTKIATDQAVVVVVVVVEVCLAVGHQRT